MKRISVTLIVLISCLAIFSQETIDYLNVGKTIKFGKQKYSLAWSSHPTDYYYIQEWLPKGEAFDNYSQMFTVSLHFSEELTPLIAVQSKAAELDKRGMYDKICNYNMKALQLTFISERSYGDDIMPFLNSLKDRRENVITDLTQMNIKCRVK